jgi:hypothetical protein
MQEAVFRGIHIGFDEGVDIWKCNGTQACRKTRKEKRHGDVSQDSDAT